MIGKVIGIAKEAGIILLEHYKHEQKVEFKKDEYDPVTAADKEADRYISEKLRALFPGDAILSEESHGKAIDFSGRVWMVDPLDGTKEFIKHNGMFGIEIGLCVDGAPVLGVMSLPINMELYCGEKGMGAYLIKNGKKSKLTVSKVSSISETRLVTRNPHGGVRKIDKIIEKISVKEYIEAGGIGVKVGLILTGRADAHINSNPHAGKWDTCAPQVIIEEAGGKLTDIYGLPLDYKQGGNHWEHSFVVSNGAVHEKLIKEIKKLRDV